jgi:hypothetical protein
MSDVTSALGALKTLLATIDPSPQPALANVYVYPADYGAMDYGAYPWAVVSQTINREFTWGTPNHANAAHRWEAEVAIMLGRGPVTTIERGAVLEAKQVAYLKPLATLFKGNQGLGGEAIAIGNDGNLFYYTIGNLSWDKCVHWGIWLRLPVVQYHSL